MHPDETFRFQQFEVRHAGAATRVGTDAVLLGAWANIAQAHRILDVGTGTGIIALMAAQRNAQATVEALDIQAAEVALAEQNFQNSPWAGRLYAHACALQHWEAPPYDHVISNPPFFTAGEKAPRPARAIARHAGLLPHTDLLRHARRLLVAGGKLSVIIPASEKNRFTEQAQHTRLFVVRQCAVQSKPSKPTERFLLELSDEPCVPETTVLTLSDGGGRLSREYHCMTADFYLERPTRNPR
ncbi:MAG: methyltransferase [Cyclobacteriaceae bacterium]|jgi:tRNA1Val (adenine37-N6)-methyltransferase|nr:methyltransferase [Cyclobacteriaceae bacterium]